MVSINKISHIKISRIKLSPTFKCELISLGSLSGTSEYTFVFFPSIGSIDLLNSSSSIMTLVSDFSFSSPIFFCFGGARRALLSVAPAVGYAHCALETGRVHAPHGRRVHAQTKHTNGAQFTVPNKCGTTIRDLFRNKSLSSRPYLKTLFIETEFKEC